MIDTFFPILLYYDGEGTKNQRQNIFFSYSSSDYQINHREFEVTYDSSWVPIIFEKLNFKLGIVSMATHRDYAAGRLKYLVIFPARQYRELIFSVNITTRELITTIQEQCIYRVWPKITLHEK